MKNRSIRVAAIIFSHRVVRNMYSAGETLYSRSP